MAGTPKRHNDLVRLEVEPELGQAVLDLMAEGKQMARICEKTGLSKRAIEDWLESDAERAAAATRARTRAAHALAGQALEIADEADADHPGELQKAKLRIQARHWTAERWGRKDYGAPNQRAEVTINLGSMHLDALRARNVGQAGDLPGIVDVTPRAPSQAELDEL